MKKLNSKGFSAVEGLLILIIVGMIAGVGWYVWHSKNVANSSYNNAASTSTTTNTSNKQSDSKYQSKLYPSLSFTVPDGWKVNEPTKYDESTWGPGSADSKITITKGSSKLTLDFSTLRATGFEGYSCYNYKNLVKVGDLYRFTDKDGLTVYENGVSKSDKDWTQSSTGYLSHSIDNNPNYCVSFPYIATHKSTLNKKDYPESPFNGVSTDVNDILVWVSASLSGETSKTTLSDANKIITSFSKSVDW